MGIKTIVTCDRCQKEIKKGEPRFRLILRIDSLSIYESTVEFSTDMDLCFDCRKTIKIWDAGRCSHELS